MSVEFKAVFSKTRDMRYISHLDLTRMFHRATRRAGLPVAVTKGFSPRLKISITKALKLGVESHAEEAVFCLDEDVGQDEFMRKMNEKLPEGVRIESAKKV